MAGFPVKPDENNTQMNQKDNDERKHNLMRVHNRMNEETARAISKHSDHNDKDELILAHHLRINDVNDSLFLPTLIMHMNRYKKKDHEASKREIHFRHQMRRRKLADSKTGHRAI